MELLLWVQRVAGVRVHGGRIAGAVAETAQNNKLEADASQEELDALTRLIGAVRVRVWRWRAPAQLVSMGCWEAAVMAR